MAAGVSVGPGGGGLPLVPGRKVGFDTDEGSWISLDVSPDGGTIVFELLGRLYAVGATGGEARAVTGSMAFDSQPAFAPDGTRMAFVSDRSGAENVWVARPDGGEARQVTSNDSAHEFVSPAWSADGSHIFVSLYRSDRNATELWRYPVSEGAPSEELTQGRFSALGAAPSPDGRHLYYAARDGRVFEDDVRLPRWSIRRLDLATRRIETIVTHQGSAIRPRLSPDGASLVYGARFGGKTGLRVRDLRSGDDRRLVWPVERDAQECVPSRDLLPGYAFTPNGKALIAAYGGKIRRIDLASGEVKLIPFTARVERDIGPSLRLALKEETGPVRARIISDPSPSPDGGRIAFSALGRVQVMDLPAGAPRALIEGQPPQFMPSWSPCGRWITFATWTAADAGHVWLASADGSGAPHRLSSVAAYHTSPVFSPDGQAVFVIRSSNAERMQVYPEPIFTGRALGALRQADLVELAAGGDGERIVCSGMMGGAPQFTDQAGQVFVLFDDGLNAVALDGSGRAPIIQVVGPGYYFLDGPQPADDLTISPDGRWLLAQHVQQLHLVAMPPPGAAATTIDLSTPAPTHRKLTSVGADFCGWADGGATITWALGANVYRRPLASVAFDPKGRAAPAACRPAPGADGVEAFAAAVEVARDAPGGALVLRGATAITMRGEEVVADADIVVVDGRIAGVGRRDTVPIPAGAEIRDLAGCYIAPGLIDSHAHWGGVRRGVMDLDNWDFQATLAWGVTAGLDPSTLSIDMLAYQDLLEAGRMIGPRVYSTGVAVFSYNSLASLEETRDLLSRYARDYRLGNLKQYRTGPRRVRQWVAMAAREMGLMPTCEGAIDMKLDLTQVIDGFAGNEHSLGAAPLYADVVQLFAQARTSYTPTLQCSHGGPQGLNAFIHRGGLVDDPKLKRFFPPLMLERLFARAPWADEREYVFAEVAASAAKVQRAGGLLAVGSHGNVAGLGFHWEMQAYAAGGMRPHEVLRAATMGSAETIGRQEELGSLEAGKFADLIILERDPLADIAHAQDARQVMKGGRLYDAETLDELWPQPRPRPTPWWAM